MSDFDFDFGSFEIEDETVPVPSISDLPTEFRVERHLEDDRGVDYTESSIPSSLVPFFNEAWSLYVAQCESEAWAHNYEYDLAAHYAYLDEVKARHRREIADVMSSVADTKAAQYDYSVSARKLKQQYFSAMRQLRLAIDNFKAHEDYLTAAEQFERETAGLYWREFALPHQLEGAKILASQKSGVLGDKMGLGKTLTSLIFADMVKSKRLLVVVPADVIRNYEREIKRWAPHRQVFPFGKLPKAQRAFALQVLSGMDEYVVTVNYEAWRRDSTMINALIDLRFDTMILDEAHVMKDNASVATRGVREIRMAENVCPMCGARTIDTKVDSTRQGNDIYRVECDVCEWNSQSRVGYEEGARRSVKHVLPMTGTPILNKPEELFPLLNLIRPNDFRSLKDFREDFLRLDTWTNRYKFRTGGMESLVIRLGSSMVSRDKTSAGVILPKQEVQVHDIDFDTENYAKQWKVIQDLSKHAGIILESGENMSVIDQIALITRQRQANVWPAGIEMKDPTTKEVVFSVGSEVRESLKLDRAEDIINEYRDERFVIFSQFKTPLRELERRLNEHGISAVCYDGDTPKTIREEVQFDFDRKYTTNGRHKWDVVLANYKTGGVGLNFTCATQTVFLDEEWGPGKAAQAMARTDRVGQTDETTVHILRLNNTIDTWLANLIQEKADMINGFESEQSLRSAYLEALKNGEA